MLFAGDVEETGAGVRERCKRREMGKGGGGGYSYAPLLAFWSRHLTMGRTSPWRRNVGPTPVQIACFPNFCVVYVLHSQDCCFFFVVRFRPPLFSPALLGPGRCLSCVGTPLLYWGGGGSLPLPPASALSRHGIT